MATARARRNRDETRKTKGSEEEGGAKKKCVFFVTYLLGVPGCLRQPRVWLYGHGRSKKEKLLVWGYRLTQEQLELDAQDVDADLRLFAAKPSTTSVGPGLPRRRPPGLCSCAVGWQRGRRPPAGGEDFVA